MTDRRHFSIPFSRKGLLGLAAILTAAILTASACSSSKNNSNLSGASASHKVFTIGVLTDLTGEAAGIDDTTEQGIKAGVGVASEEGYTIKYVMADGQTSPSGALSAAKKLVDQDHVDAVIALSSLTFSAAPYLTSRGIPVVGTGQDGPEWATSQNMFSIVGIIDYSQVFSTTGQILKTLGVSTYGGLGYGLSPSSAKATKADALSAQTAGLKVGYNNANFAFGSTNVDPVALQMKSNGVDGVVLNVVTSTGFALVQSLAQNGAHIKAALLLTGYGGDLLNSGGPSMQAAQGDYFATGFEPVELKTAATTKFQQALAKYAGVTNDPTYIEYQAYVAIDALVQGLKAAGPNPSNPQLVGALGSIKDFDAAGLWGGHFTVDLGQRTPANKQCSWVTQFQGSSFHPVNVLNPICGTLIPGLKV
jgi:ABC-type branched-subunit amino acid transport system substrate-binding protein